MIARKERGLARDTARPARSALALIPLPQIHRNFNSEKMRYRKLWLSVPPSSLRLGNHLNPILQVSPFVKNISI